MSKFGNDRWKANRWDGKDPWSYRETGNDYSWLKRIVVALTVFLLVYAAQASETSMGRLVVDGVRYMLTTQTDFSYLSEQLAKHVPLNMDTAVFKRIQNTLSKPADPLQYMSRPVKGKIVSTFGWQTDPASKQGQMQEGVDMEATATESVLAAASGKVKEATESSRLGKVLIIEHGQDVVTVYGRLGEVLVKPEEMITQGQVVAKMGKSSATGPPLLYFEVREKGKAVDPTSRIQGQPPGN